MNDIKLIDPLEIILSCTKAQEQYQVNQFRDILRKLYCYQIFKPILDLVVTIAMKGYLKFVLYDQKLFDLDEGNCKTIEGGAINQLLNRIKVQNQYVITIKKVRNDVIIHEISHMVEKEMISESLSEFCDEIREDISMVKSSNPSLSSAVESVMIKEVALYPEGKRDSELFARYFQLLAMSKEVSGFGATYGYSIIDVMKLFVRAERWLIEYLYPSISGKIDNNIAKESMSYIKKIEDIKHTWADEKIRSVHYKTSGSTNWSKGVKSIKEDPFK